MLGVICMSFLFNITDDLMSVKLHEVHSDYYMLVDPDILVVTVNRQLICQFHSLMIIDDAMMTTISQYA